MSEIRIQVVPDPGRLGDLAAGGSFTEKFADRARELGESLGDIANELRDQLDTRLRQKEDSRWELAELQLQFSLDLEAGAGVVVARVSTTAGFVASLTWRQH
jgi:hypothetical protein